MIIVSSGHVDHGKTALIQALTGTNTAHLPEEKKRGMTIDLGYAYVQIQDRVLGFIDVPGHEKFLANMLAGMGGIHYAMLMVAADEGIKPQTEEHLTILRLLQIEQIIVVITKADRASSAQIDALCQRLRQQYPFLKAAPFFITSAQSQQGIAELGNYLAQLPNLADQDKPFRYAIDRIFSVKGAGTVLTGTAFSGKVQVGDELYLTSGETVRVKNIHAQNQSSEIGVAGQRLALNISADLDRTFIERGHWLFEQMPIEPTTRISLWLEAEHNLTETQMVHIYHAATRTTGKLSLLTAKNYYKNQQGLAELTLDKPLFLAYGDKLILRSADAKLVIAGAKVIEINSPKRYKRSELRLNYLKNLIQAKNKELRIQFYLQKNAVLAQQLCWVEQLTGTQLDTILRKNGDLSFQDWCFSADFAQQQKNQLLTALRDYHLQHNDQLGLAKARLYRIACVTQPEPLIYHFIEQLLASGELMQTRGWIHTPDHKIQFSAQEWQLWEQVFVQFKQQSGQAVWVRDVANSLSIEESIIRNFLYKAGKLGYLIPIVKDRFMLSEDIYHYAKQIKVFIQQNGSISVNQLRDQLNFGRKMTVQLIEYFDRCGFLRRKGNLHILRDGEMFD